LTTVDEVERVLGSIDVSELAFTDNDGGTVFEAASETAGARAPGSKPSVLLVEDDDDSRNVISCVLEQELFSVDVASGGHEALEMLYESMPDLIISDVMMPTMGGLELLQRLRSDKRLRDIPVLMLTANGSQEAELKLMNCGADDFVCKTTKMEIILARARRLVQRVQ
jgi:DNA-binding response OmpR family regulator